MHATVHPVEPVVPMNPVQLCFGSVRHERLRPAPNRFAYGVYFLRLPLRVIGPALICTRYGLSPWLGLGLGLVVTLVVALLLALLTLRMSGHYMQF